MALRNIALVGNTEKYKVGARSTFKHKNQLLAALVIGIALTSLFMITAKPAPIWNSIGPGEYVLSNGVFVVGGWGSLTGKYYKVTADNAISGEDASNFEVAPAGFPIGFTFIDKGYGINTFNVFLWLFDFMFWTLLSLYIIYKFGFFVNKEAITKQTKKNFK
jgi:hypothetical protein